jgi:hypothetical protein
LFVAAVGCTGNDQYFIIRIGRATLTDAAVDSSLRSDLRSDLNVRQNYIQNWINSEAVYQKALKEGFDKEPAYQRQIEQMRKELLIQAFMENELEKSISVTPKEAEDFYVANKNSFVYSEDHVRVEYFLTRDKNKSKKIASDFQTMSRLRKKDFMEQVSQAAADSDLVGSTEFQPRDRFEEKVAKQVFLKNATDEIVGPIVTRDNYYSFWHVVEIRPKGTYIPFGELSSEIEARIKIGKRKQRAEELISKIREETEIEYHRPATAESK